MKSPLTSLSRLAVLAAALSLAACGRGPADVQATLGAPAPVTSGGQLLTLRVPAATDANALLGAVPGSQLVSFQPDSGLAILTVPGTLRVASLNMQALRALDASVTASEPDIDLEVQQTSQGEGLADGLSVVNWAGGVTNWAGGVTNWAGGETFLEAKDWSAVQAYWNYLGLPLARQLAPAQGAGVKVAVLDTGAELTPPLLRGHLDTANAWDFVDGDPTPQEVLPVKGKGKYGHGTAVSGIILQVAPNVTVLPLRVLNPSGRGPMSRVLQALDRAVAAGAQVVNLSLGSDKDSPALDAALAAALARGVVVVNSSGNSGTEGMVFPAENLNTGKFGDLSGLVAVGSVTLKGEKSSFSTYSLKMTVSAPGEAIVTAYPDGRLTSASGTSFAAPAVSGALALALSTRAPGLTPASLVGNLRASTTPSGDLKFKGKLGAGVLNVGNFLKRYR